MKKFGIGLVAAALIVSGGTAFAQEQECVTHAERAAMSPEEAGLAVLCVEDAGGPLEGGGLIVAGVGIALLGAALSSSSGTN